MKNSEEFYANKSCRYFPCHRCSDPEEFNCKFCYCPLYTLGSSCGGDFRYTEEGIKDCSLCMVPHRADAADYIRSRFKELSQLARSDYRQTTD